MFAGAAVDNGVGAASIVADHASDHAAVLRGRLGCKENPVRNKSEIEFIADDSGLHAHTALFGINLQNAGRNAATHRPRYRIRQPARQGRCQPFGVSARCHVRARIERACKYLPRSWATRRPAASRDRRMRPSHTAFASSNQSEENRPAQRQDAGSQKYWVMAWLVAGRTSASRTLGNNSTAQAEHRHHFSSIGYSLIGSPKL